MAFILEVGVGGRAGENGDREHTQRWSRPCAPCAGSWWLDDVQGSVPACVAAACGEWRAGEEDPEGRMKGSIPAITQGQCSEGWNQAASREDGPATEGIVEERTELEKYQT